MKHEFPEQSSRYPKLISTLNITSTETIEVANNYNQKRFVN